MVAQRSISSQLNKLNLRFRFFGRAEVKELRKILVPGEVIRHCVRGYYHGGSGLLVATNRRLLLIDKQPFYLNLEEMSYKSIRDVRYKQSFLQAQLFIDTGYKRLQFRSISDAKLKMIFGYVKGELDYSVDKLSAKLSEDSVEKLLRPYQDPSWRPHHPFRHRKRPTKFYSSSKLATLK